jgi:transposase
MSNVLSDEKKQQVLVLGRLGWSLRQIEQATGVRRETAAAYLKAAGVGVRAPRRRRPPAKPASQVSTDSGGALTADSTPAREGGDAAIPVAARPTVSPHVSKCEPYRELIEGARLHGRNAMAIYQDLVSDHGFGGGYASVKRFVRRLGGERVPEAHPVIVTAPGEEGQVDYGDGPMVRHPETGKYRRTRLFVLTLGWSRKSVRLLVWKSGARVWAELHERAFCRLGGAPRTMVLDNLKEGVLLPDVYDPTVNPVYRDVLAHYGAVALPCRIGHPDRKGKVESGIGHTQRTPLRGLRFESLADAQAYLDRWERDWADTRIHGTTKRQVRAMFEEERRHLLPLPLEPFRYYAFGKRTVHLDGAVEVGGAYYHAPPGWIGRIVAVQWDDRRVRLLDPRTGELLRELLREERGRHRCHPDDRPKKTPRSTEWLLTRAGKSGSHVGLLCRAIHGRDGEIGVRRILGVLSLVKKNGAEAVDHACAFALQAGVPTYRFVRNYLVHRPPVQLQLRQIDPLIRELTHYRALIEQRSQEGDPR